MEVDEGCTWAVLEISFVLFDDIGIERTNVKKFYFSSIKLYLWRVNVEPSATGELVEIAHDPLKFTFVVPLLPQVELGSFPGGRSFGHARRYRRPGCLPAL